MHNFNMTPDERAALAAERDRNPAGFKTMLEGRWKANPALQAEFVTAGDYAAYVSAAVRGRVSHHGGRVVGAGAPVPSRIAVADSERAAWREDWRGSSDLQAEFPSADAYAAFKTVEATGRVSIGGRAA